MHNLWLIARREYVEGVRSKAFRISTVLIPVVFGIVIGIGNFSSKLSNGPRHIVIASNDPGLAASVVSEMTENGDAKAKAARKGAATSGSSDSTSVPNIEAETIRSENDLGTLNGDVESQRIDGYLWLNVKGNATPPEAMYASRGTADMIGRERMRDAVGHAMVREALLKRGLTDLGVQALLKGVDLKTVQIKNGRVTQANATKSFFGAYAMAFLLYLAVTLYGMNVARSVVAEKSSRIFEVLLACAKPEALLAGKLLGVGAVGLTQMAIWIGSLLILGAPMLGARLGQGGLAAFGVTGTQLVFFFIYFLLGFFFYSALSAGFGATVSQESEVQQFGMLLVLPQMIGLVMIVYILGNPNAWPVVLLSLFPPCMPIVMCLRMSAMTVPAWQLGLSVMLMAASIWGVLWVASRIYRVGILMYGKRATLPEMLRWLKYS